MFILQSVKMTSYSCESKGVPKFFFTCLIISHLINTYSLKALERVFVVRSVGGRERHNMTFTLMIKHDTQFFK